jgi:hypothetical protein
MPGRRRPTVPASPLASSRLQLEGPQPVQTTNSVGGQLAGAPAGEDAVDPFSPTGRRLEARRSTCRRGCAGPLLLHRPSGRGKPEHLQARTRRSTSRRRCGVAPAGCWCCLRARAPPWPPYGATLVARLSADTRQGCHRRRDAGVGRQIWQGGGRHRCPTDRDPEEE